MSDTLCPNCKQYKFGNDQGRKLAAFGVVAMVIAAMIAAIEWFYTSANLIQYNYGATIEWGLYIGIGCIVMSFFIQKRCENCHYTIPKTVK